MSHVGKAAGVQEREVGGDMGVDAALKASAGWLLSFVNTATVPAKY